MNLSPEEKRIRKLLREHKVEVDTSELWGNLDPHLREKKSRKGIVIWLMIGMSLLGLRYSWGLWNTSIIEIGTDQVVSHLEKTNHGLTLERSLEEKKYDKEVNKPLDQIRISGPNENTLSSKVGSLDMVLAESKKTDVRKLNDIRDSEFYDISDTNVTSEDAEWSFPRMDSNMEPHIVQALDEGGGLTEPNIERVAVRPDYREMALLSTDIETRLDFNDKTNSTVKPIHIRRRLNVSPRFYTSIGAGIIHRSVEAKNSESIEYATVVGSKEQAIEHFSVEGGLEVDITSKIYGRIGLSYSRLTNRIRQDFSLTRDTVLVDTSSIRIDPAGTSIYNNGNVQAKVVTTYRSRQHSYHHIFEIPIIVGVKLYEAPRLNISLETGLFVNIGVSNSGSYLDETGIVNRINTTNNPYRSHLGASPFVGVKARYNLRNGKELFVQPYWKKYGKSFTRDDFNLDIKNQTYGIQLGMQMNF